MLWRGRGSLPGGERQCRDCRAAGTPKDHVLFNAAPVRHLAVVRDDGTVATPAPSRLASGGAVGEQPASVLAAAESGSELDQLLAMSARIARSIADAGTNATALAALVRRQLDLLREIAELSGEPINPDRLTAMRARVARALDDPRTSPTALSALTHRQTDISRELAALAAAAGDGQDGAVIATTADELWDASVI
ncbi:hypothetical protein SEA_IDENTITYCRISIS_1 [Mycobacterium phage IdentityCrisis]|uniref:Terminase small subunit n=1 Tax=Mycobacterium phage IdentityCrisis TaxID=2599866 RepID=A0A5J6TGK8_9CAUD|nr:hypothetical protein QEH37_gp01 [Mycobacterium phage IdentityCrisis]QFG10021.1 hypothetical protein SEA_IDENTITYCRISIS_1 [Mycobacterium phage IdentityCrisis]